MAFPAERTGQWLRVELAGLVSLLNSTYRPTVRITTLAEYGVICALHLARRASEGPITGRDIAARERLPVDYVEQILLRLRRAEIVRSTRGARGGYELARDAESISIRAVIAASEMTTFDLHCLSHPVEEERCSASHACSIRPVWQLLQQKIDDVLEAIRLSDLMHEESQVRALVGLPERSVVSSGAPVGRHALPVIGS